MAGGEGSGFDVEGVAEVGGRGWRRGLLEQVDDVLAVAAEGVEGFFHYEEAGAVRFGRQGDGRVYRHDVHCAPPALFVYHIFGGPGEEFLPTRVLFPRVGTGQRKYTVFLLPDKVFIYKIWYNTNNRKSRSVGIPFTGAGGVGSGE